MESIKILSANCQGLGDINKRKDVFNYLHSKKFNIVCLQDTHFTESQENTIENQWGYKSYFSSFSSNSRGVSILFNNNFEFQVHHEKTDKNGNFLILDVTIQSQRLTLVVVYGPNRDDPSFYQNIVEMVEEFENTSCIFCGDFNLVLNPELDYYNYTNINNEKAREKLIEIIEDRSLVDPFRELHPEEKRYTWRKRSPLKQSRLDFFLISDNLLPSLKDSTIEPGYRSDHSIITLELVFNEFKRGKGLWKFNNSLLYETEYIDLVKNKILEIKTQYLAPQHDNMDVSQIPNSDITFTINDQLFLETLLMEIRGKTISYSSYKKKRDKDKEQTLINEIQDLETTLINDQESFDVIENKKKELETIRGKS